MDLLTATWTIAAWLSPVLWLTFLIRIFLWDRVHLMPVWAAYAVMAIPFDIAWAWSPTVRWPLPILIPALLMRIAATLEAIRHVLRAVQEEEGQPYAYLATLFIGAAVGIATLAHHDPRGVMSWLTGAVRVGCAVAMLTAIWSWAKYRLRQVPFCWWHSTLMLLWLSSTAIAGAMSKGRGDGWDLFAVACRDTALWGWIWLVGPRMLSRDLPVPGTVRPSVTATR